MNLGVALGGVTAGHGEMAVQAVNVPVSVGGMDVAPGELIHIEAGAALFVVSVLDGHDPGRCRGGAGRAGGAIAPVAHPEARTWNTEGIVARFQA